MKGKPWLDSASPWDTEGQFLNWMRGELRKIWTHHPIKNSYINARRFKAPLGKPTKKEPDGKMIWSVECEHCGTVVKTSQGKGEEKAFNVDHIHGGKGFNDFDTMTEWIKRTFYVTSEDIRILCTPCHKVVNHMQKTGFDFELAQADKYAIQAEKRSVYAQKDFLEYFGINDHGNKEKRREAFRELFHKNPEALQEAQISGIIE